MTHSRFYDAAVVAAATTAAHIFDVLVLLFLTKQKVQQVSGRNADQHFAQKKLSDDPAAARMAEQYQDALVGGHKFSLETIGTEDFFAWAFTF